MRRIFLKLTAATSLSMAAASIAAAADLRVVKAPVIAPPAAYDWTGFYLGGNLGYSVGRNHSSETFTTAAGPAGSSQSFTLSPAGALGGGQIGYNWQAARNWVFGVEGDWQWTGQKDSVCISFCVPGIISLSVDQKLSWIATLRGRIGYAHDGWLWYATGGAAWGRVTESDELFFTIPRAGTFSHTKGGWTIGGGVETALAGTWTAKLEYLYVDLGSTTDVLTNIPTPGGTATETITKQVRDHIIRLGLNYRFGGSVAGAYAKVPGAVYKAPPAIVADNWSGFYLGGNVGYGVGRNHGSEFAFDISSQSFTLAPAGWLGGGQVGYNWHAASNWVVGIEADWQWTGQTDSVCISRCNTGASLTVEQKLHWLATLRGRIGYAWSGWLWYLTGGGAWGRVTENDTLVFLAPLGTGSFSHTKRGWTAGVGVETSLTGNWSAKFEYLYVDLDSTTDILALTNPGGASAEPITKQVRDHIFRVGLNYRFGPQAIIAKY